MNLAKKYRPRHWSEVLGQSTAVSRLRLVGRAGFGGRGYWISGPSGTGKTTLAWLIALELADALNIEEVDATTVTPHRLQGLECDMAYGGLGERGGRAVIINEAQGLRRDAIRQLLVMLERLRPHCAVIFTTTRSGQQSLFEEHEDAAPLLSRCIQIALTNQGLNRAFAQRLFEIAELEGLGGKRMESFEKLLKDNRNNFRAALAAVEAGEMMYLERVEELTQDPSEALHGEG